MGATGPDRCDRTNVSEYRCRVTKSSLQSACSFRIRGLFIRAVWGPMDINEYASHPFGEPAAPWTTFDDFLLYTCHVVSDVRQDRIPNRSPVPTSARLEVGEVSLVVGPAVRSSWRAIGDGSYMHRNVMAFGRSGFVVGSLIGSAVGNAARRRRAAADARQRWVTEGSGELTVTPWRVLFGGLGGRLRLWWTGLDTIDLIAPQIFECSFNNIDNGRHHVSRLQTPWASLIFALAAHAAFPAHPRWLSGSWLPPDFENRCAAIGRPCPLVR